MAWTGEDIRKLAQEHLERETIRYPDKVVTWINECVIMAIGSDAKGEAETSIVANKDEWYSLPTGLLEIYEIEKDGDPYYGKMYGRSYYGDFDIRNNKIRFPYSGTYKLYYWKKASRINLITNPLDIHEFFYEPIALFVAARYKQRQDENNEDAARLMSEFAIYRQQAVKDLKKLIANTKMPKRIRLAGPYR